MSIYYSTHARIKIRALFSKVPLILLLIFSFSGHTFSQDGSRTGSGLDRSSERYKELFVVFQAMHGELGHENSSSLSAADRNLVLAAVTEAPYFIDSLAITQTACDYHSSVSDGELDVEYMASILAQADQTEYESAELYWESLYGALSSAGRDRFNQLSEIHAFSISNMRVRSIDFDGFIQARTRDEALQHFNGVCERLPSVIDYLSDGKVISTEIEVTPRGDQ